MAHVGEEGAFGAVGLFRGLFLAAEFFGLLTLSDVLRDTDDALHSPGTVVHDGSRKQHGDGMSVFGPIDFLDAVEYPMPDHVCETCPLVGARAVGCRKNLAHGPSHKLCFAVSQEATRRNVDRLDGAVWCHDNDGV